jgi:hypothetical protein
VLERFIDSLSVLQKLLVTLTTLIIPVGGLAIVSFGGK